MEVAPFAASRNLARCSFAVHRRGEERQGKRECESSQEREKEKPPLGSSMRTVRWSDSSSSVSIRRDYAGVFGSLVARETYA